MTYLDTSALIKRFVAERGTALVAGILTGGRPVATAIVAYVEVHAGLARRRRTGDLSQEQYALASRQFEEEWPAYARVDLGDEVLFAARDLVARHPLRSLDAVHLASALAFKSSVGEVVQFAAADERLLQAAAAEGLAVVNVERADRV